VPEGQTLSPTVKTVPGMASSSSAVALSAELRHLAMSPAPTSTAPPFCAGRSEEATRATTVAKQAAITTSAATTMIVRKPVRVNYSTLHSPPLAKPVASLS
jgi:hypothetical protein